MDRIIKYISLVLVIQLSAFSLALAQNETMNNVQASLKVGNSKELVKHMDNSVEIGIAGQKSTYSRSQAEFVMKEFFGKNPSKGFAYIHKGSSQGGLQYAIGKYSCVCPAGSYRVLVRIKQVNSSGYKVYNIDFNEE